jgi:hypothetical protein
VQEPAARGPPGGNFVVGAALGGIHTLAWGILGGNVMRVRLCALLGLLLAGCATSSSDITAAYVSPVLYQNYTCQQLAMEAQGVSTRAAQVSGAQDSKRTKDQIATGVAVVLFWPAAFLVGGDGPTAAEVGQLKGQMVAIEQANIQKRCGIQFDRAQAPAR